MESERAETESMEAESMEAEGKRLHPKTLVQRLLVAMPALVFLMIPVIRDSDSTAWFNVILSVAYTVVLIPFISIYYVRFRYWITPKEIVIHSGVVTRRRRNIPLERIQNIEIEQALLPRILGTAKVSIYTAGSPQAEGVLEYVSLEEAGHIRTVVRQLQKEIVGSAVVGTAHEPGGSAVVGAAHAGATPGSAAPPRNGAPESAAPLRSATPDDLLFGMNLKRVWVTGMFRFSLLYIALIFSILQMFEPDPTVFFNMLLSGPMQPWAQSVEAHPVLAAVSVLALASLLGWLTGILVTANRFYGFKFRKEGDKLHRRHGLLTITEGTIPIRRVQSYIIRTNPVMELFGWYRLELQTMGINLKKSGFQVAAPFARLSEIETITRKVSGLALPQEWEHVSPHTIRRFFIRIAVVTAGAAWGLSFAWDDAWWLMMACIPGLIWSIVRYRRMGYARTERCVVIRRGVIRRMIWMIPIEKMQTITRKSSVFQRRLGLESVYVDTPGASPMQPSDLIDIPMAASRSLVEAVYEAFGEMGSAPTR